MYSNAGLISDIMSKGKRMTYEELCNVVEPVWFSITVVLAVSLVLFFFFSLPQAEISSP
jgi:hypothetical protein